MRDDPAAGRHAARSPAAPVLHRAVADDLPAIARVDGRAFGVHYEDRDLHDIRRSAERRRAPSPAPGLVSAADDGLLRRFDAACAADRGPRSGTGF
ncbi:MAG: hypothetical protein L0H64_23975 [Pseudonocardia sp.]|nr:hypothetical protein [Pseudonocardia sp.]